MLKTAHNHISDIIASLSLLVSLCAALIAEISRRTAAHAEVTNRIIFKEEKRTEFLVEIELKNSAVSNLLLTLSRKLLMFQKYPFLIKKYPEEHERLSNSLDFIKDLKAKEPNQRILTEGALEGESIEVHERALADLRRLRVSLENDVQKENQMLELLLYEVSEVGGDVPNL